MSSSVELSELLFPSVPSADEILAQHQPRQSSQGEIVTRFAPSPTGFVHIGSIYIAQVGRTLAQQSQGTFILRVEDTDQQRKLENGIEEIVECLLAFGLEPDEGYCSLEPLEERGEFGPYLQSERHQLYQAFVKQLVAKGAAYPSFQTAEELEAIREEQKRTKAQLGYYGHWAKDRDLSLEDVKAKLDAKVPFVIRLRSPFPNSGKIVIDDAIRGCIEIPRNDRDHVLLKSDGLPTYHLAVVVDDMLMGVNLILRGDEWLSTLPLHVELFELLGFQQPTFAHIAPIGKLEGSTKRKLSKRKDPEANVAYYAEKGYPKESILSYLMNIADSSFEDWRVENPTDPLAEFPFNLKNMSVSIALFDPQKLDSVSQEVIATLSFDELFDAVNQWAQQYSPLMSQWIAEDKDYAFKSMNIGRDDNPPRKDLTKWSDIESKYDFFIDSVFEQKVEKEGYHFPELKLEDMVDVLEYCLSEVKSLPEKDQWLSNMKVYGKENGFAMSNKDFKRDPEAFKGKFGQMMVVYRIALANRTDSPDLYQIVQTMGPDRVSQRIHMAQEWLRKQ